MTYYNMIFPSRSPSAAGWVGVATGSECTFGLKSDGSLWAWGENGHGQVGDGTTTDRAEPICVEKGIDWAVVASSCWEHTMALTSSGQLFAWGRNGSGELGDRTTKDGLTPMDSRQSDLWVAAAAGDGFSLGVKSDGTVWAWGRNFSGQLGDGTDTDRLAPVNVLFPAAVTPTSTEPALPTTSPTKEDLGEDDLGC